MRAIIIEQGEKFYTHLRKYFKEIDFQRNYNWLITSYFCCPMNEKIRNVFSEEVVWLSGDELTDIIYQKDFQWIWGVLSGFPKDITKEEEIALQHPLAEIEIIAWDSSMTVIKSKNDEIIERFCEKYRYVKDWKTTLQSW